MGTGASVVDREALLASAQNLGPLSATAQRLVGIVADPAHDVRDVVDLVSLDPRFATALLRRTNVGRGSAHRVRTVREASMLLGPGALLSTALASVLAGPMSRALPTVGLTRGGLWRQAVTATLAADVVRTAANVAVPAEVTVAALLHDIGLLVLAEHVPAAPLAEVARLAAASGSSRVEAERAVLGVEHAELGAMVARHWRLPATVVEAIAHHHHAGAGLPPASAVTSLAHSLALAVPGTGAAAAASGGLGGLGGLGSAGEAEGMSGVDGMVGVDGMGGAEGVAGASAPGGRAGTGGDGTPGGVLGSLGLDPGRFLGLVVLTRRACAEQAVRYRVGS